MRFTIGSRALTRASAFNPTTTVVITDYNPNVFDAHGGWRPMQVRRFDGQAFGVTAALRDGALAVNKHREVWVHEEHVTVLPDLCKEPEHIPQSPVDVWAAMSAAQARAERITASGASYCVGAQS
jgi:hypothetical protein